MKKHLSQFQFVDIHYHANPDLYKRRYSAMEAGRRYQQLQGAVVLKSHLGSTAVQATMAQKEGLPVFPSIVLNAIAGGLHYRPVIQALAEYQPEFPSRMLVHLPTITGRKHLSKLSREMASSLPQNNLNESLTISEMTGKLKPEVIDLIKLSLDYPIVLSTGHASKEETCEVLEACDRMGCKRLLLNQPANPLCGLNSAELTEIAKNNFVWIEQTALTHFLSYQNISDFSDVLCKIPSVIYSSDLGQTTQPDIETWQVISKKWFEDFGISERRKEEICLKNPLQLLAI